MSWESADQVGAATPTPARVMEWGLPPVPTQTQSWRVRYHALRSRWVEPAVVSAAPCTKARIGSPHLDGVCAGLRFTGAGVASIASSHLPEKEHPVIVLAFHR